MKRHISIKGILLIQVAVIIYTFSGIAGKLASGYEFLSPGFVGFIFLELCVLGFYAVAWQQIIKRFDLSIAYVNRATAIFWSMLWSFLIFRERVTLKNMAGIVVIFLGILLVNADER